jgi:hypothetical protein
MRTGRHLAIGMLLGTLAAAALAQEGGPPQDPAEAQTGATGEGEAAEPPKREPITQIGGTAPTETLQERMERFKREKGAGSDKPFEGFATQAEQEAQQRRAAALGEQAREEAEAEEAVETRIEARETVQDRLQELGAWGASNCAESEPAWSLQDDFIRHRKLARDDFRYAGERGKAAAAVRVPKVEPGGFAAIVFSCELKPQVNKVRDKEMYVATLAQLRYYALLSRKDSWLSPDAARRESYVIGHQQLHFDMANAFATWLTSKRDVIQTKLRGFGRTPEIALGELQLRVGEHMLDVHSDFDMLESVFDRDTKHGGDAEKQTAWNFRVGDGFPALAKGLRLETRKVTEAAKQ